VFNTALKHPRAICWARD